ncbi:MAG: hypothetical protein IT374_22745 [Polyangiaceae bacterium]|nr:hypothetical protein [Polyangiaceae bacterium]
MNREKSGTAEYVIYVRHTSSSAANGYDVGSAAPTSLATVMRNNILLTSLEVGDLAPAQAHGGPPGPDGST